MFNYLAAKARFAPIHEWPEYVTMWEDSGKNRLLGFETHRKGKPLVIVAPEAGHNSLIVHYSEENSLLNCAKLHYPGPIYILEKLPATQQTKHFDAEYCFLVLTEALDCLNESVNLVGLCQGGWQSAVVTARHQDLVNSLTLAASPLNFHVGNSKITSCIRAFGRRPFQMLVDYNKGILPGEYMLNGFLAADPLMLLRNEIELFENSTNEKVISRQQYFDRWYMVTQDMCGPYYMDAVDLFENNNLHKYADFGNVKCKVKLITGAKDKLTPPEQTLAFQNMAANADFETYSINAGHIGVFMSTTGLRDVWPVIFSEMGE